MWDVIWIVALYALGIGFFQWLGGIGAASSAIQQWGRASAERRRRASTPSS